MNYIEIKNSCTTISIEFNNTPLAQEFKRHLPIHIIMSRYDNREYYATLDYTPTSCGESLLNFTNGDICYFPKLNSFAIFYDRENESSCAGLIRIGKIASNLDAFKTFNNKIEITIK